MNIIQKVNRSRYTLKEILGEEWDVVSIPDFSDQEIEKRYTMFHLLKVQHYHHLVSQQLVTLL